jgi:hypothetical protein
VKKFFKILVAVVFLMVATVSVFFIYSVAQLPHPAKLRQMVKPEEQLVANTPAPAPIAAAPSPKAAPTNENPTVTRTEQIDGEQMKENVQAYLTEDFSDIRVCQNLSKLHDKAKSVKTGLDQDFMDALGKNDRENSLQESWRTSLKYVFQQDSLKKLFQDLVVYDDVPKNERSSMLEKLGFYTKAAKAVYDLYTKKSDIENFANHSYHLSILAQVVNQKPELANDPHILDFCYQMQNSMAAKKLVSPQEERAEVLSLIDYAGLKPTDLNFDPNQYIHFQAKVDKKTLEFGFMSK